ncbi:MAG: hypothetical protein GY712_13320 [Oceanicoccus sp.]|uniref:hypothetical protein n=1 Tax=Oceanicoccus sp. TaxID=2691044 RepID=UPI002601CF38|nr:hypothetical protein [Oceanicoccus sp.]MCP3908984.1 hypothetical protein [Oceanicoccus sp.]MDG1772144.1 hypothetical protein [Oceanicoccus sp.]
MLNNYIDSLQSSIIWAQQQDDIDVLCLARDTMNQLMDFVTTLPTADQMQAHQDIEDVLPMEWPLWMEACRYEDGASNKHCDATVH